LALGPRALAARAPPATAPASTASAPVVQRSQTANLPALLAQQRQGYWHFGVSHALVLERALACDGCHKDPWGTGPATSTAQRLVQLESCTKCH
ncbi:MAG: hypothetical protein DYH19_02225, partial [Gammaproteobacteria bacterium PRO8]|nr:hypothetical protein [Gammaproteobacteria bacterium PRO8]